MFASSARDAWARVQSGEVRSTSIYARCLEFHWGVNGRLVKGVLVAVDLVRCGADPKAHITRLVAATELTPGQRQVQKRLDRYLADPTNPTGFDLFMRADSDGAGALEPLRHVVATMYETRLEPLAARRSATAPVLTRSTGRRCGANMDGFRCEHPAGHDGMHYGEANATSTPSGSPWMAWDDRARPGHRVRAS